MNVAAPHMDEWHRRAMLERRCANPSCRKSLAPSVHPWSAYCDRKCKEAAKRYRRFLRDQDKFLRRL